MSKHHHHCCPRDEEEIVDRIMRRCCDDRRPERLLPIELSPEEIRELRCMLDCLRRCLCRPNGDFLGVESADDFPRRR
jgi:hypothetical protein